MSEIIEGKVESPRGARITKRWEPKKWEPIYETIVALSCTGLSNTEVGKRTGYGAQQVSNILNTPQGKKMRELVAAHIHNENVTTIGQRIGSLQDTALKRVESFIKNEEYAEKAPLVMFDRAMQVLKSGLLKEDRPSHPAGNVVNATNAVFMTVKPDEAKQLSDGLNRANQVRIIHSGDSGSK